jgi:hypothetical protein
MRRGLLLLLRTLGAGLLAVPLALLSLAFAVLGLVVSLLGITISSGISLVEWAIRQIGDVLDHTVHLVMRLFGLRDQFNAAILERKRREGGWL